MKKDLTATRSIEIFANIEKVWDALINPEKIKTYFFGVDVKSDWQEGSNISWVHEDDDQKREDKGEILEITPNNLFKYSFWSELSEMDDSPENFSVVTCHLEQVSNASVKLIWKQEGFKDEDKRYKTEKKLPNILNQIKLLAEKEERETA